MFIISFDLGSYVGCNYMLEVMEVTLDTEFVTPHTHTHIGFPCIMGTFHQHNIDIIQYKLYILAPKSIPKTHTHTKKKHSRLFPHK